MPETLSYQSTETENYTDVSGNEAPNYVDPNLDDSELFSLVDTNADVICRIPWLGGTEMALSPAMSHILITRENIQQVIAMVVEALANPVIETEETEEKENHVDEETIKEDTAQEDTKRIQNDDLEESQAATGKQPEIEIKSVKQTEQPKIQSEKSDASGSKMAPARTGVIASHVQDKSEHAKPREIKVEAIQNIPVSFMAISSADTPALAESRSSQVGPTESSESEIFIGKNMGPADKTEIAEGRVNETLASPKEKTPVITKSKSAEISPELASESANEVIELNTDEPVYEAIEYEGDNGNDIDFSDGEEVRPDYLGAGLESDLVFITPEWDVIEAELNSAEAFIYGSSDGSEPLIQKESVRPEQSPQINIAAEEIEVSLIQLNVAIEVSETDVTEEVTEILDKIIEAPLKLETETGEDITEAMVEEELEELFIQLFDRLGIDYNPELIESLAQLTFKLRLTEEIEKLKTGQETSEVTQGSGTHEIIKKLLIGISNIKKYIASTYAIGKFALRPYRVNYLTS